MNYLVVPGIKEKFRPESTPKITPEAIVKTVCDHFSIIPDKLKTKDRSQELVHARHVIFYLVRRHTNTTLKVAGLLFNRDHTTVIHGLEKLQDIIDTEPNVKSEIELLETAIKSGN